MNEQDNAFPALITISK